MTTSSGHLVSLLDSIISGAGMTIIEPEGGTVLALSDEDRRSLLQVARGTLEAFLGKGAVPEWPGGSPALLQKRGAFVTLWHRESGSLRGCCGEIYPRRPLIESVAHMAIASATRDPRFAPVSQQELPKLQIEISALTPLLPIEVEEIEVGRHGLFISKGVYAGLLLPEVPTRYDWNREQYLAELCLKAGLPEDAWSARDAELYAFETEKWGEED
jgi:AmmeMemoRadiSam system protein A